MANPYISLRPLSKRNSVVDGEAHTPEEFARFEEQAQAMANVRDEEVEMRSYKGVSIFEPMLGADYTL